MENVNMFNNATAQLTFHDFLDRMRHPSAADLVRSIKHFIGAFLSNAPDPEKDSQNVQEFLSNTENVFKAHPLWAGATEEEFENSGEGLEKYLMTKLFAHAFAPIPEDTEQDQRLSEKMSIVREFIRPEHLDIREGFQNETSWLLAQKELQKINTYKAPRDKLVCILNCCRVINNLLLNVSMANKDNPPGADDFLPVLIYVVIKANPPQLHSNLLYIQRYRHQSRLVSEASYFFTNLVSAESFIEAMNSASLTMDPKEFDEKMEAGRRALEATNVIVEKENIVSPKEKPSPKERKTKLKGPGRAAGSPGSDNDQPKGKKLLDTSGQVAATPAEAITQEDTSANLPSTAKLEADAFGDVLEADKSGELVRDYPFLYATAGDLRVLDVESLLHEYKELVLRYVSLRKAVESSVSAEVSPQKLDSMPQVGTADTQEGTQEDTPTEALAQILTRPEDTAELFAEETSVIHSDPGILSEVQEPESKKMDASETLQEEIPEMNAAEDFDHTGEVAEQIPESKPFPGDRKEEPSETLSQPEQPSTDDTNPPVSS